MRVVLGRVPGLTFPTNPPKPAATCHPLHGISVTFSLFSFLSHSLWTCGSITTTITTITTTGRHLPIGFFIHVLEYSHTPSLLHVEKYFHKSLSLDTSFKFHYFTHFYVYLLKIILRLFVIIKQFQSI